MQAVRFLISAPRPAALCTSAICQGRSGKGDARAEFSAARRNGSLPCRNSQCRGTHRADPCSRQLADGDRRASSLHIQRAPVKLFGFRTPAGIFQHRAKRGFGGGDVEMGPLPACAVVAHKRASRWDEPGRRVRARGRRCRRYRAWRPGLQARRPTPNRFSLRPDREFRGRSRHQGKQKDGPNPTLVSGRTLFCGCVVDRT